MSFKGAIVESSDNVVYTENIKKTLEKFEEVEGFITNLQADHDGIQSYLNKLLSLKARGFKVQNSIARLQFQLEQTKVSILSLGTQKKNRLNLLKIDVLELSENVLDKRLIIDDKERARVEEFKKKLEEYRVMNEPSFKDIKNLVTVSLDHMRDLQGDVGKFDAQIQEASVFVDRNYDVGDLIGDLKLQKETLEAHYNTFLELFSKLSTKHYVRTTNYIRQLQVEADKIRNATKEDSVVSASNTDAGSGSPANTQPSSTGSQTNTTDQPAASTPDSSTPPSSPSTA